VALATGLVSIVSGMIGARIQRSHGRELERDRFRHDIASRTAEARLTVHTELAAKVADAYRKTINRGGDHNHPLDSAKNYYYDNRFFFSRDLGNAFRSISKSLAVKNPNKQVLEENLNTFFNVIRDDLLLKDLSESVSRAVSTAKATPQT